MIFKNLQQQPPDKILALMTAFKEDPRDQKLDLGVGVYKDPTCLLYTSPSPRDLAVSRMPSSA